MIPQRDLSLLSNRLAERGGRRIPEAVLERDYCLSWFLVGLSRSPLRDRLAFKGGTALKKCYFADYRFSEDLDFTLTEETSWDEIERHLAGVFEETRRASSVEIRLDHRDRHSHGNCHTFYLAYEGHLPQARGKAVKTDITIREHIVLPLEDRPVLRGYEEYRDLPEDAVVRVYSLDEVAVEKTVALLDRARNEPRDLYDLWFLTAGGHVRLADLVDPVVRKLEFRGLTLAQAGREFAAKEARYKKLWQVRLAAQMVDLPGFDAVYREVRRTLRQGGFSRG
ncbi:MAG: nucleotidyl transferase AbiEii/AbiGii toxin family protein [Deltaproteobacteria bacterium]|nr:MAG: nucleotidyl transferase AbiEii/AbiGii toxin family protein [Deltaproteobacteria bacterium]